MLDYLAQYPSGCYLEPQANSGSRVPLLQRVLGLYGTTVLWPGTSHLGEADCVTDEDNASILLTFSEEELEALVKEMKMETALGPDSFPVLFFKRCWPLVKHGVLHILNDFVLGRIDVSRLNFGIMSMIPKVPGVDQISQYRPVAIINVIFKIISKAYASRLDPIANKIIIPLHLSKEEILCTAL
jgi:hypothetical protein